MITREDFDLWRDNPVTVHVFKQFGKVAQVAKDAWVQSSWDKGDADPNLLIELRAKAEIVNDLITVSYEDIDDSNEAKADAKG